MLPPPLPRKSTIQPARPSRSALAMAPCTRVREGGRFGGASTEGTDSHVPHCSGQRRCVCVRRDTGSSRGDGSARHRPVKTMAITEHLERRPDRRERLLHRLRGPGRRHHAGPERVPIDLPAIDGMLLHDRDQLGQIRARGGRHGPARRVGVLVPPPPPHPAAVDTSSSARTVSRRMPRTWVMRVTGRDRGWPLAWHEALHSTVTRSRAESAGCRRAALRSFPLHFDRRRSTLSCRRNRGDVDG